MHVFHTKQIMLTTKSWKYFIQRILYPVKKIFYSEYLRAITVNDECYRRTITNFFWPKSDDMGVNLNDMWFQLVSTTSHSANGHSASTISRYGFSLRGDVNTAGNIESESSNQIFERKANKSSCLNAFMSFWFQLLIWVPIELGVENKSN